MTHVVDSCGQELARGAEVPDELARLFAHAQAVVGVDTGLTHLAAASGTRTVGIYCGSDPALTGIYGAARAANVGALGVAPSVSEVQRALQ